MGQLHSLRNILLKNDSLVRVVLVILFSISFLIFIKPLTYSFYPDFASYYYSASIFLKGGNPYIDQIRSFGIFLYPPTTLLVFIPFTFLPLTIAGKVFTFFSIVSFVISVFMLLKMIDVKFLSNLGLLLIVFSLNLFPAKFTLGMGQINNFVLLAVVLFLFFYIKRRWALSGLLLAIGIILKVFPIILLIIPIIESRWRLILSFFTSLLFMLLITYPIVGKEVFSHFFLKTLSNFYSSVATDYYNQSLSGFLLRQINNPMIFKVTRQLLETIFLSVTLILTLKSNQTKSNYFIILGLLITLAPILNSNSWQHHLVWLIIPLIFTFKHVLKKSEFKYLPPLFISYILIALNIKKPATIHTLFWSHALLGVFIIYFLNAYFLLRANSKAKR